MDSTAPAPARARRTAATSLPVAARRTGRTGSVRTTSRLRGFPPVIDAGVTTLVLGSFPSPASLGKGEYYGHPRNAFWPIMARITGVPLAVLPYAERLQALLAHGIGLWDVIDRCERNGALDADIRNARHNAFDPILAVARGLSRVCFNGQTAGRMAPWFDALGHETVVLPSTSPAFTMSFEDKLARWRVAIEPAAASRAQAMRPRPC